MSNKEHRKEEVEGSNSHIAKKAEHFDFFGEEREMDGIKGIENGRDEGEEVTKEG